MQFLSDVYLSCPECKGTRYRSEILEVKLSRHGKEANIAEVLDMTIAEALEFFKENKEIVRNLEPLVKVGLDYLKLGQPIPTLSGGEAQRLKLAKHLADALKGESKHTLFIFDEPTRGIDVGAKVEVYNVMNSLVKQGKCVIMVSSEMPEILGMSDRVIVMRGGEVMAEVDRDSEHFNQEDLMKAAWGGKLDD